MSGNARQAANAKYRRGTVLGLTVAEIFILLLFLLMLVFLVLWQDWQIDRDEQREQIGRLQQQLESSEEFRSQWEEPLLGIETPDEIRVLRELKESMRRSDGEGESELLRNLVAAERELRETHENNESLREALEMEKQANWEAGTTISRLSDELRTLTKGVNPPCWYELVEDEDAVGGAREKGHYAFDIGVFDEHMVIRRRTPPDGGAVDDADSTYEEEWNSLGMAEIRYDAPLSDAALVAELQRIRDAGKQGEVRSYSCVFFVRVWDETSSEAKARWQEAYITLQSLFGGTPLVRDEPWQGSN